MLIIWIIACACRLARAEEVVPFLDIHSAKSNSTQYLCEVCACADDRLANPYLIDCRDLQLESVPEWDDFLLDKTEVTNVHLKMSFNYISVVAQFSECSSVDAMHLDSNAIVGIEPFAWAFTSGLKYLSLSDNQLFAIHPNAFSPRFGQPVSGIEVLDLSFNRLFHLDADVFDELGALIELNLRGNPFGTLDSSTQMALNSLHSLLRLDFTDCGLAEFPAELLHPVEHLEELSLGDNRLKSVPEVVGSGKSLLKVVLDGNWIGQLDENSFGSLMNLRVLSVCRLKNLTTIKENAFSRLDSLEVLQCRDNYQLTFIDPQAFRSRRHRGPKRLQLDLSSNGLTHLNEDTFKGIEIEQLDLRNNSWLCNCELAWVQKQPIPVDYLNYTRCKYPVLLHGMLISDLDFSDFGCKWSETAVEKMKILISAIPPINHALGIGILMTTFFVLVIICAILVVVARRKFNCRCRNLLKKRSAPKSLDKANNSVPFSTKTVMYTQLTQFHDDLYDTELWDK